MTAPARSFVYASHKAGTSRRVVTTAAAIAALAPGALSLERVAQVLAQQDTDDLLRQQEAAELLKVSACYLRRSDCPKVLLPPARGRRPLVRYRRSEVLAWAERWTARRTWTR